jgi:glutathionylspermidine synthase
MTLPDRLRWRERLEEVGFVWHSPDGLPYWQEGAAWVFSLSEIEDDLEAPTAELEAMCLELVGRIISREDDMMRLAIPQQQWDMIANSWKRGDRNLYGRFDLAFDGTGPAKLLEYNADTPTSLFEASVIQWMWLEDHLAAGSLSKGTDQFNSLHEKLIAAFGQIMHGAANRLHLAHAEGSIEDQGTVDYLEECAKQAGLSTSRIFMHELGISAEHHLVDMQDQPIDALFKLYPWEWMFRENFALELPTLRTQFIEPVWKSLLSNKGILPLLWEMAPEHPNLLEAYFRNDPQVSRLGSHYVEKPLFSREGANVSMHTASALTSASTEGPYGAEGLIRQAVAPLAKANGRYVVIGSWVVASEPAGIGLREDMNPITQDTARFVPHIIQGE